LAENGVKRPVSCGKIGIMNTMDQPGVMIMRRRNERRGNERGKEERVKRAEG
jgi:hypothetical protein